MGRGKELRGENFYRRLENQDHCPQEGRLLLGDLLGKVRILGLQISGDSPKNRRSGTKGRMIAEKGTILDSSSERLT